MGGLAALLNLSGDPVDPDLVSRMTGAMTHRGRDGLSSEILGGAGLGAALLASDPEVSRTTGPVFTPDRRIGMVADTRVYHRRELLALLPTLPEPDDLSDPALLLAAWENLGQRLLQTINADFAFVAWHPQERRLVAARDPFGARPLYYRRVGNLLGLASEPRQLFELDPGRPPVNHSLLRQHLVSTALGLGAETFHHGIERLLPGHMLTVENGRIHVRRYFQPVRRENPLTLDRREMLEALETLLRRAVRARLAGGGTAAIEISGGYDSTTVASLAAESATATGLSEPIYVSQSYPGLGCDESPFVAAFERRFDRKVFKLDAPASINTLDISERIALYDRPDVDIGFERFENQARTLKEQGARVLLTGLGGDELFWPPPCPGPGGRRVARVYKEVAANALAGTVLARLPRPRSRPPWLLSRVPFTVQRKPYPGYPWRLFSTESFAHYTIWSRATKPGFLHSLEHMEQQAAHAGITLCHPLLDRELVEFVANHACSHQGDAATMKPLLQETVGHIIPRETLERNRKAVFSEYFDLCFDRNLESLKRVLFGSGQWAADGILSRQALEETLRLDPLELRRRYGRPRVWRAMLTELWLRHANNPQPNRGSLY